jgi:Flp pilus assembly protein TadD
MYAPGHANLAIALIELGQHDEGIKHLEEAVRLKPNDVELRANLERAQAMTSDRAVLAR